MREQFPWFFDPTEEELQRLWEEATFAFDANVLLNLYRVDRETTEDYFKIFRELGDRIFLPHEAANQFFLNRRKVIRTEQNSFSVAKERVQNWADNRKQFDKIKDLLRGGGIGQIIEDEIESVFNDREDYEKEVEDIKEDLIEQIKDLEERFTPTGTTRANAEEDEILGELMEIFEGKTGKPLDKDMDALKDTARKRYKEEKPPGYKDYDGEDEVSRGEWEDFLIWKQLMEFAKQDAVPLVFITGEEKPDWWRKNDKHEIVRPRHELLREFAEETEEPFWMLTVDDMIDGASEILGLDIREKSAEQTEIVSTENLKPDRGRDYYFSDKEMKAQKIEEPLNIILKRFHNLEEVLNNIDEYPTGRQNHLINKNLSILESTINDLSDSYEGIDHQQSGAVEIAAREIKRDISRRDIQDAREALKSLSSIVDNITKILIDKIKKIKD